MALQIDTWKHEKLGKELLEQNASSRRMGIEKHIEGPEPDRVL